MSDIMRVHSEYNLRVASVEKQVIGQTAKGTHIEASIVEGGPGTVVLVGGLAGKDATSATVEKLAAAWGGGSYKLIAIPVGNPDAAKLVFPPTGVAYKESTESHVLWRWLGVHGPDLVLIAGPDSGLAAALSANPVALMGRIPAQPVGATLPQTVAESEAHHQLTERLKRSPMSTITGLSLFNGHDLSQISYINALALIAQLRIGDLLGVKIVAEPWVNGSKDPLARPNSTALPAFLLFAELAERTGDARYLALVRKAANLGFTDSGEMKESMPFHDEMSDSVFMGTPLLARAGRLTGERRYYDMAERHLLFMQRLDERGDGLYRHTPLTEAAWGRGNGFPALGLTLTLSDMPKEHRAWPGMLLEYQHHMEALSHHQDRDGMWHEVIDEPGSYAEFTATAMIGFSMLHGIRNGWLDQATWQPIVDKAWTAINARIDVDGRMVDVCESTGKMKSLTDYLNRTAILDRDTRGGAMAMLFATEMAGLK
jgi:rhamnogalacturonyl hydrolase YesR